MAMTYKEQYDSMRIPLSKDKAVKKIIEKIAANRSKYEAVSFVTNVPWTVIAVIHYRESTLSYARHLHNGDPLTARTTHVPAGRPKTGEPPYSWEESAIDALTMQGLTKVKDWSIENTLAILEKYNGLGYKKKGLPSPYLWSWSSLYKAGKYVADRKFDPKAVDAQCGCAVLLKYLL